MLQLCNFRQPSLYLSLGQEKFVVIKCGLVTRVGPVSGCGFKRSVGPLLWWLFHMLIVSPVIVFRFFSSLPDHQGLVLQTAKWIAANSCASFTVGISLLSGFLQSYGLAVLLWLFYPTGFLVIERDGLVCQDTILERKGCQGEGGCSWSSFFLVQRVPWFDVVIDNTL